MGVPIATVIHTVWFSAPPSSLANMRRRAKQHPHPGSIGTSMQASVRPEGTHAITGRLLSTYRGPRSVGLHRRGPWDV